MIICLGSATKTCPLRTAAQINRIKCKSVNYLYVIVIVMINNYVVHF